MLDTTPIKTEGLNAYSGKGTIFMLQEMSVTTPLH